jgi:hypothetical protein
MIQWLHIYLIPEMILDYGSSEENKIPAFMQLAI